MMTPPRCPGNRPRDRRRPPGGVRRARRTGPLRCRASARPPRGRPASSSTPARVAAYSGSSLDTARGCRRSMAAPGLPGPRRPRRGGPAPAHRPALDVERRRTRHGPRRGPAGRATSARAGSPARRPGRERHRGTGDRARVNRSSASPTCPRPASSTASAPRVVKSGRRSAALCSSTAASASRPTAWRMPARSPSSVARSAPHAPAASRSASAFANRWKVPRVLARASRAVPSSGTSRTSCSANSAARS